MSVVLREISFCYGEKKILDKEGKIVKDVFKEVSEVPKLVRGLPNIPEEYLPKYKLKYDEENSIMTLITTFDGETSEESVEESDDMESWLF